MVRASFSLGLDFLFIPVYTLTIGLWSVVSQEVLNARKWPFAKAGTLVAYGVVAAGVFDIVENVALLWTLFTIVNPPWPQLAAWCAIIKFSLLFLGIVYAAYGGTVSLAIRFQEG